MSDKNVWQKMSGKKCPTKKRQNVRRNDPAEMAGRTSEQMSEQKPEQMSDKSVQLFLFFPWFHMEMKRQIIRGRPNRDTQGFGSSVRVLFSLFYPIGSGIAWY